MAHVFVFPDQQCFEEASTVLRVAGVLFEILQPPRFCQGVVAPTIRVSGELRTAATELRDKRVPFSGSLPYLPFGREIPQAGPPDPQWKEILGDLRITLARQSVTDPLKLRIELALEKDLEPLIPIMARLIRGGSYCYDRASLAFEEEHRLLTFTPRQLVISRADDLLDAWIMIRSMIELALSAWHHRFSLEPDIEPRHGIGTIEIFRRLPSENCGRCDNGSCMEFAMGLFTGRCTADQCLALAEPDYSDQRESLFWLLRVIGLVQGESTPRDAAPRMQGHERGRQPGAHLLHRGGEASPLRR